MLDTFESRRFFMRLPRFSVDKTRVSHLSYSRARRRGIRMRYYVGVFLPVFRLEEKKRTDSFSFVTDDDISAHSVAESKRIKVFPIPVTEIELSRALFPPTSTHIFCPVDRLEIRYLASSLCHTFCLIIFLPVSGGRGLSDCMGRDNNGGASQFD